MPITLETVENGFVQFYAFSDPWMMDELVALYDKDLEYRRSVTFPVHALVDCTRTNSVGPGFLELHKLQPLFRHTPRGSLALVGLTDLQRAVVAAVLRVARFQRVANVATLEEGWAYLREQIAGDQQTANSEQDNSAASAASGNQR